MRTMFGRIAAAAAIATLLTITTAAAETERPTKGDPKEAEKHPTSQQERMKACNVEAAKKELKGEERRAFMSSCLRTH